MTFLIRPGAPLYQAQLQARALDTWRDAELVVHAAVGRLPCRDRASRPGAFAGLCGRARRRGRGRRRARPRALGPRRSGLSHGTAASAYFVAIAESAASRAPRSASGWRSPACRLRSGGWSPSWASGSSTRTRAAWTSPMPASCSSSEPARRWRRPTPPLDRPRPRGRAGRQRPSGIVTGAAGRGLRRSSATSARAPGVELTVVESYGGTLLRDLRDGRLDAMIAPSAFGSAELHRVASAASPGSSWPAPATGWPARTGRGAGARGSRFVVTGPPRRRRL